MLYFVSFFSFALNFALVLGQKPEPNRWHVDNFYFERYPNGTKPLFGASFELTRTYWKKCVEDQVSAAYFYGSSKCGWLLVGQPLKCESWKGGEIQNGAIDTKYYSCNSYAKAAAGESALPEVAKKWVRWRVFDFHEYRNYKYNPNRDSPYPFENFTVEIVHGVPTSQ
jgi:hypothetical protein